MRDNILEIRNITKSYANFKLDDVSFEVPSGSIVGLVGENGAGKSTIIKSIIGAKHIDSGEIKLFGKDISDASVKDDIGVVLDECNFPEEMNQKDVSSVMKSIYTNWEQDTFDTWMKKFSIPKDQKIKEYSRGMQMKLSIAVALSHQAKFLLLDEATSGLDPVVRDDLLDILLEFIQEEDHGVLISSHIISDLEKASDYITFIHKGKVFLAKPKDELRDEYVIAKCTQEEFAKLSKSDIEAYRDNKFCIEVLMQRSRLPKNILNDPASIEDVMLFYIKGKEVK